MFLFKNRHFAFVLMLAIIIVSTLISSRNGLSDLASEAENVFYNGEDNSTLSIQNDLSERINLARNFITLAQNYINSTDVLITNVQAASDELFAAKTISGKYTANKKLGDAVTALYAELEKYPLSSKDASYRARLYTDFTSRQSTISHDPYNSYAAKYNEVLNSFPANILSKLSGLKKLEYFN
ncbi:MAG: LemA family protein [Eubacteriaceae bacterium]|jgi:hypothetical protein|nr:LemA family protein [Eubacteriaceae bacterium]